MEICEYCEKRIQKGNEGVVYYNGERFVTHAKCRRKFIKFEYLNYGRMPDITSDSFDSIISAILNVV